MKIQYPLSVVGNLRGNGSFIEDFFHNTVLEFGDNLDLAEEVCELLNEKHKEGFHPNYYDDMDNEYPDEEK